MENNLFDSLFAASQARVLRFLTRNNGRAFFEREIAEGTGVSRSAVNLATRALHQSGLLQCEHRGRMNFYSADDRHPFVRQFKALDTLASLEPLLKELRPLSRQIYLFGSCAKGTNTAESDIDLFILTAEREQAMKIISRSLTTLPLQPVIMNNQELAETKEKDAAFFGQVKRAFRSGRRAMNWELEFKRCLEKRWLVSMPEARYLVEKELSAARDDLAEAETSYQRGGYKWCTIQSYYVMFHTARALLYSRGYRKKSHHCLSVAMRRLFVGQRLLEERLIDALDDARALREDADYRTEFSEMGAQHGLNSARELVNAADRLLANWKESTGAYHE